VHEIMTRDLVVVTPRCELDACMAIMTAKRIRHVPVLRGNELAGIVSVGDVVKHLSREREAEIRYLHDYIAGRYPA
jgi:CBS domain-containing protein